MSMKHLVVIGNKKVLKNKQASNQPTNRPSKDPSKESGRDRWLRAGSLEALRGRWTLYGGYWEHKGPDSAGLEMLVALTEQKGRRKNNCHIWAAPSTPEQSDSGKAGLHSATLLGFNQVQGRTELHLNILVTFLLCLRVPTVSCLGPYGARSLPCS